MITISPRSAIAVLTTLAVALALLGTAAAEGCARFSGPFSSTLVAGPPCDSDIYLCTEGDLDGDIDGAYHFRMNSLAPDPSPAHPTRVAFEGESLIDTGDGTMRADDTGWMDYGLTGPTPFETTVNVVEGTGASAGVTGTIVATGDLHFDRDEAVGQYRALLCR